MVWKIDVTVALLVRVLVSFIIGKYVFLSFSILERSRLIILKNLKKILNFIIFLVFRWFSHNILTPDLDKSKLNITILVSG